MGKKGSAARQLRSPWRTEEPQQKVAVGRSARATFHLPGDLLERVRNTVVALSGPPELLTMSKFAENALRRELKRLENRRPGDQRGKPFGERQGQVRKGRPIQ